MSGTTPQGHKKRSGIPIAPSETESAAGRDDAKRQPPSPMRRDCRGCCERFPRKDPGVFDLLGSSLSCDTTGLTPPAEYLCLRVAEPLGRPVLTPEEARAPSRNNVLPHTANATETRFSLEVLAVDALSRHVRRVTIFQLSNRRRHWKADAASRFFSRSTPNRKRNYTPQQAAAVMEMRQRGDGYGTIASAMGMTTSMVRRIIQQQQEVPC